MRAGETEMLEAPPQPGHVDAFEASHISEFAAVLWLPDPEQRHGFREYYVRKVAPKPGGRPFGFGRPVDKGGR